MAQSAPHPIMDVDSRSDPVLIPREFLITRPSLSSTMRQDDRGFAKLKRYIENRIGGGAEVCCLLHDEDSKVSWPISVSIKKKIYIYS